MIQSRVNELGGYGPPSLAAMAIWISKENNWSPHTNIDEIIIQFIKTFHFTGKEIDRLFDVNIVPPKRLTLLGRSVADFRGISHQFSPPPDAPTQTEGALTAIRMRGVGPAKKFALEFGERLTLIAGDNGLGKSFLLDTAWWALTGTWAGRPAHPITDRKNPAPTIEYAMQDASGRSVHGRSRFDWRTHSWIERKNRPSIAAVSIYARVDGSFAIADEVRRELQFGDPKALNLFTSREIWRGRQGEIEGLIRDWVSWQHSSNREAFTMLKRVLAHLSPTDMDPLVPSEPVRLPRESGLVPTIKHVYGDVPVLFASAGVQRILLLVYLIIWSWQEHLLAASQSGVRPQRKMVIVIDEIEAHLHPKWQRLVLPSLMSVGKLLSEYLDVQVIAATHSPMVLASVETDFSEDTDVLAHLQLVDGSVTLDRMDFYRYGDMSSWLMSPVFGLAHARSREAENAIEQAKRIQLQDEPSSRQIAKVTEELKRTLAPDDTFWSRWIYFAKQAGVEI